MGNTKIEWTGKSWNPLRARRISDGKTGHFCIKVSAGCKNCYAEKQNGWTGTHVPYAADKRRDVEVYLDFAALIEPLRWSKPTKIFPCSMTDLFAHFHTDAMIDRIMAVIVQSPEHTYQVLTKRPERMLEYFTAKDVRERIGRTEGFKALHTINNWPLKNLWLGVSVEDQAAADERIPLLLQTPAAVRWISAEPLLGPIEFSDVSRRADAVSQLGKKALSGIDWVVVGGESKAGARPMHPDWARSLRDQCLAADVAFFFKQWGEFADLTNEADGSELLLRSTVDHIFTASGEVLGVGYRSGHENNGSVEPDWKERGAAWMGRIGKKNAGRLLDGVEHNAYPEVR